MVTVVIDLDSEDFITVMAFTVTIVEGIPSTVQSPSYTIEDDSNMGCLAFMCITDILRAVLK